MNQREGDYVPIRDAENIQLGMFDKPLPCFGCGIGWFSFLLGFVFPLMWYFSAILYFGKYYNKDPKGAIWPCCLCNRCYIVHNSCGDRTTRLSAVILASTKFIFAAAVYVSKKLRWT
ncbi:RIBOSOMAL PROTEIN L18AE FAMILY [Salix koriyanagi]|uniref:RIBOSOMAL PROTEIN L18AE FAMILY n=1 Tax=Salix koriyanagi TaxID=2511006 RepID=A0A9Q0T4J8_9ROSI|nr:RIBOSOMAL PROTEIN L18AE FAMILY [Salix koriyanagi]